MGPVFDQAAVLQSQFTISLKGILEASATVLVTTLEDCVWLIPFVARAPNSRIALAHASVFILTFFGCAAIASLLAVFMSTLIGPSSRIILEIVGAVLCWCLSAFFLYRSCVKRIRKQQQLEHHEQDGEESQSLFTQNEKNPYEAITSPLEHGEGVAILYSDEGINSDDTAIPSESIVSNSSVCHEKQDSGTMQPWVIVSLTILGSLDEVSYFPALIVGQIFTIAELITATLIASLLILLLVDVLKQRCGNLLLVLDQIPLYGVIAAFAAFLTVELFIDLTGG